MTDDPDEFDNIPDDFSDIPGIDWETILAGPSASVGALNGRQNTASEANPPPPPPSQTNSQSHLIRELSTPPGFSSSSSLYFSDNDENIDVAFLAELDRLEQRALAREVPSSVAGTSREVGGDYRGTSLAITLPLPISSEGDVRISRHFPVSEPSSKNFRAGSEVLHQTSPKRKGKSKAIHDIQDVLSTYEDELTCPICCDLLVAAHVGNPCGHTFCGACGWRWHIENNNNGCPCCRQSLDKSMPMIPNIALDNTVEKHVKALALFGATEWEVNGRKYRDWATRKESWRREAPKREQRRAKAQAPIAMRAIQVFDPPPNWFDLGENVYIYESDNELIPRPIRRARRRR